MPQTYDIRYERAPGKVVYTPSSYGASVGKRIIDRVRTRYEPDPIFFHIGTRGGHVAALRSHLNSLLFSRFDLANFYGHCTRSKVARALANLRFGSDAFSWAYDSVVEEGGMKVLPQGFHQSPLLATLVLEQSALGVELKRLSAESMVRVTVYMDDIIVSGTDGGALEAATDVVLAASDAAGFPISQSKMALCSATIEAFNCDLTHRHMQISNHRLERLARSWESGNGYVQEGIERYVRSVSDEDLERLAALTNVADQ